MAYLRADGQAGGRRAGGRGRRTGGEKDVSGNSSRRGAGPLLSGPHSARVSWRRRRAPRNALLGDAHGRAVQLARDVGAQRRAVGERQHALLEGLDDHLREVLLLGAPLAAPQRDAELGLRRARAALDARQRGGRDGWKAARSHLHVLARVQAVGRPSPPHGAARVAPLAVHEVVALEVAALVVVVAAHSGCLRVRNRTLTGLPPFKPGWATLARSSCCCCRC